MKKKSPSDAAAPVKCCSGILRRFICSGGLPTHPSDHFLNPNPNIATKIPLHDFTKPDEAANVKHAAATSSSPGVVAKLMGLDSFPHTTAMVPKNTTLGSLLRSRSVNSIDFLLHFDPAVKKGFQQQQHRRVRTSVSFREGVLANDECVSSAVLELQKVDETAAAGYEEEEIILVNRKKPSVKLQKEEKERKPRNQKGEIFQEKRVTKRPAGRRVVMEERKRSDSVGHVTSHKKDIQERKRSDSVGHVTSLKKDIRGTGLIKVKPVKSSKEELEESKSRVKRRKNKVLANRLPSSGSHLKKIYPEGSALEVARGVRSRNPLISKDAISSEPWSVSTHDSETREVTAIIGIRKNEEKMKSKESFCNRQRMVEEICRAAEEDVKENMESGVIFRFEASEDICQQFGKEILQVLLKQLVAELVLLYGTREINLDFV